MDEKRKHEELIQEQLDIENVKINELTQIVNFYRKNHFANHFPKNYLKIDRTLRYS